MKRIKGAIALVNRDDVEKRGREMLANWCLSSPLISNRVRVSVLRRMGVRIGSSSIGWGFQLTNFNVVIGDDVAIGRGVRMRGVAQIRIGNRAQVGDNVIFDTDSGVGEVSVLGTPIQVSPDSAVPLGSTVFGSTRA